MIPCLFRYSTDAGYIKLIVWIYSTAPEAAWRNFHFFSLFTQLLGFSFGFGPTSAYRSLLDICSLPRQEGVKQQWIRGLLLTQTRGRVGYSSHNWNAG